MAAAAAYGSRRQKQQLRRVALCRLLLLLLVAVLVIGDAVADAREGSKPTDEAAIQTGQLLQGFRIRRWWGQEEPTTATAAAGWLALNKAEQEETAAGGRRMLIGSRAPTCTYNECRSCRHRCSVQEVPIDASDPINSAYHYKCTCHL